MNRSEATKVFDLANEAYPHQTVAMASTGRLEDHVVMVELDRDNVTSGQIETLQGIVEAAAGRPTTEAGAPGDISEVKEGEEFKEAEPGDETPAEVDEPTGDAKECVECDMTIAIKGDADPYDGESSFKLVAVFE